VPPAWWWNTNNHWNYNNLTASPQVIYSWDAGNVTGTEGSFHYYLLPFVEQNAMYDGIRSSGYTSTSTVPQITPLIKTYICPGDGSTWPGMAPGLNKKGWGGASYSGNIWVFDPSAPRPITTAMPDGTSNQVILAERYLNCANNGNGVAWGFIYPFSSPDRTSAMYGCWTWAESTTNGGNFPAAIVSTRCPDYNQGGVGFQVLPTIANCQSNALQGCHPGAMQVGMGDGSVRGVTQNISTSIWQKANYPKDGQVLPNDWNQ
jgi:hypothetical protein